MKHRVENGISGLYSRVCYGYKKGKNGMLVIDEVEAKVARNIFDWYLEGLSIGGIINRLEEKKIKIPKGKKRWSKRAI
ncbi:MULTISPECIES: recombinase family protein [Terrabacteria group]|uniref:recombinase family protein n=1 Tax=Bacillati TaxID=1783272 RepID=UPI001C6F3AA6|nr:MULTISPECIES: recombinase family protein [Terrabacteria group]MBW9212687.1 recombinase family protein [Trueperella sp. zg.1013]MBW9213178.1 recombinase family protein [Trueperella sp. zg.1013]